MLRKKVPPYIKVDYEKWCYQCKKRSFSAKEGIYCSLTGKKGAFTEKCEDFSQDDLYEYQKKDRKYWGALENLHPTPSAAINNFSVFMVIFGAIQLLFPKGIIVLASFFQLFVVTLGIYWNHRGILLAQAIAMFFSGIAIYTYFPYKGLLYTMIHLFFGYTVFLISFLIFRHYRFFGPKAIINNPPPELTSKNAAPISKIFVNNELVYSRVSYVILLINSPFLASFYYLWKEEMLNTSSMEPLLQTSLFLSATLIELSSGVGIVFGFLGLKNTNESSSNAINLLLLNIMVWMLIHAVVKML